MDTIYLESHDLNVDFDQYYDMVCGELRDHGWSHVDRDTIRQAFEAGKDIDEVVKSFLED